MGLRSKGIFWLLGLLCSLSAVCGVQLACTSTQPALRSAGSGSLRVDGEPIVNTVTNCSFLLGSVGALTSLSNVSIDVDPMNSVYIYGAFYFRMLAKPAPRHVGELANDAAHLILCPRRPPVGVA